MKFAQNSCILPLARNASCSLFRNTPHVSCFAGAQVKVIEVGYTNNWYIACPVWVTFKKVN